MKLLWLLFLIHTAFGQTGFGKSYLRNSRLCHQWSCINTKLGLSDSLPPADHFAQVLRGLLPSGSWQGVVDRVIHTCYNDRPRRYTNTCPGQALMHCTVDQLINNCPGESLRREDACAPINSLAGLNNMFSQSRYENLERNLPFERRPSWFLRNYFDTKCCNLPELINSTGLAECGFATMVQYFTHNPKFQSNAVLPSQRRDSPIFLHPTSTEAGELSDSLQVVSLKDITPAESSEVLPDPLDCCDISDFIQPTWRQECGFELQWKGQNRLTIKDGGVVTTEPPTAVTTVLHKDLIVLPQSCVKESCVFDKLNITTAGTVDVEAFKKLLDNLTDSQPQWNSAKARVLTTCLTRPLRDYDADCDINKVLACTFDVLSENCPTKLKNDTCKHARDDRVCQISSSKSRPKNRRSTCVLPELVNRSLLTECRLHSLSRVEQSLDITTTHKKHGLFSSKYRCKDLTPSTSCVMNKMGALNKYGFMDYFKMKDRIRRFTDNNEWSLQLEAYLSAFTNIPMYAEHCNSAKKLLNVVDSILMTCPDSKKKNTQQCSRLFTDITNTPASNKNATQDHNDQILKHFHHVFFPSNPVTSPINEKFTHPKYTRKIVKNPIYDYGMLSSKYEPKVQVIDVKPKVVKKPLILLPVYMRTPYSNSAFRPYSNDGIMRSPFALHNQIAQARVSSRPIPSASKPVSLFSSTPVAISTSIPSNSPI